MPIIWQPITGMIPLPMREWVRSPLVQYSELFQFEFFCPDWTQWKRYHRGNCWIRSVWIAGGEEQLSPSIAVWVDDSLAPTIVPLPFPEGYLQSGYNQRYLEFHRSPTVRFPDASIALSVSIKHSA